MVAPRAVEALNVESRARIVFAKRLNQFPVLHILKAVLTKSLFINPKP